MRNILEKRDPWGHGAAVWIIAAMLVTPHSRCVQ